MAMESLQPRELFHLADPAAALEKAIELNKVKTAEGPKITIQVDEKSNGLTSSSSTENESKISHETFDGKKLITIAECEGRFAHNLPEKKKWRALFIVWLVQISMNFNCSLYSNAIPGIAKQFQTSEDAARWGATVFLVAYAFGCELWAPWSEELGRYWVLQTSLALVNVFQVGVALAENIGMVIAFRSLGGISTAGGSITLGMVADFWDKENHQIPVAFVVFASVGGSVLGPIFGGLIEAGTSWQWAIWLQLIFGTVVQILHFFFVPETRATTVMDRIAKERRKEATKSGQELNLWGPNEVTPFKERFCWTEIFATWLRPFKMFVTEPIVLFLSLLSGFSDALIFMFVQCFGLVYRQWGFGPEIIGLTFLPFLVGYLIAWISFIPVFKRNKRERAEHPDSERAQFESRLWFLLYLAPCLPIGLIGFAWTSGGPPVPWVASMIFTALCGIANYGIYMATIDYMVCAYGPYSASATGGNGWARDFLAGVLTPLALPYYNLHWGEKHIELSSTLLAGIATVLVVCVFLIYRYGPWLRCKSKFAQQLEAANQHPEHNGIAGVNYIPNPGYGTAPASARQSRDELRRAFRMPLHRIGSHSTPELLHSRVGFSRRGSPTMSREPSRNTSPSDGRKKRPALESRSHSLYFGEEGAAAITVSDPALLRRTSPPSVNDPAQAHNYESSRLANRSQSLDHLDGRLALNSSAIDLANSDKKSVPTFPALGRSSHVEDVGVALLAEAPAESKDQSNQS